MKSISINLYGIDELSKEAQEQAFEKYQNFNVENDNWYDFEFDDFVALCNTIGINIPVNGISFSGFWSQGDGSTFSSSIDILPFINGIRQQAWKDYAPQLTFDFSPCPCTERIINLIRKRLIECDLRTKKPNRGYWIDYHSDYSIGETWEKEFPNIENELTKLDKWIECCLNILNNHLYRALQEQYEYETSPEALIQTFIANEYHFTEDGKMADRLLNFALDVNK